MPFQEYSNLDAGAGTRRLSWFRCGASPARKCLTMPSASAAITLLTGSTHCCRAASTSATERLRSSGRRASKPSRPSTLAGNRKLSAPPPSGPPAITGPRAVSMSSTSSDAPPRTRIVSRSTTVGSQPSGPRARMPRALAPAGLAGSVGPCSVGHCRIALCRDAAQFFLEEVLIVGHGVSDGPRGVPGVAEVRQPRNAREGESDGVELRAREPHLLIHAGEFQERWGSPAMSGWPPAVADPSAWILRCMTASPPTGPAARSPATPSKPRSRAALSTSRNPFRAVCELWAIRHPCRPSTRCWTSCGWWTPSAESRR